MIRTKRYIYPLIVDIIKRFGKPGLDKVEGLSKRKKKFKTRSHPLAE
jgi:hypothetical protein